MRAFLTQKGICLVISQQSKRCGIAERAFSVAIDAEDRFRGGIQKQPDSSLAFMQGFLGALPVRDFLLQLGRAFVHAPLQILAGLPQVRIAVLDLLQHLVKAVDQDADFVLRLFPGTNGVIPCTGDHLCRPGQFQDRI